jgi:WD40 repeat protein
MKYSPCGTYLAVGSHDNKVYIYNAKDNYTLYSTFDKHNSFVTALDWSADSSYLRSLCGAYEKLYFNVAKREFDNAGMTNTKDAEWASLSIKKGWDVDGTRPASEDGSHINGLERSGDGRLIATSDDFGLMNLWRYPVMSNKHKARSYAGHSEHVVRAVFNQTGDKIFTIGGYDKTLIQWRRK